jgi:hypothetical protein
VQEGPKNTTPRARVSSFVLLLLAGTTCTPLNSTPPRGAVDVDGGSHSGGRLGASGASGSGGVIGSRGGATGFVTDIGGLGGGVGGNGAERGTGGSGVGTVSTGGSGANPGGSGGTGTGAGVGTGGGLASGGAPGTGGSASGGAVGTGGSTLPCKTNVDCPLPAAPFCSGTGTCVQCAQHSHCGAATPICDAASNRCVKCTMDAACNAKSALSPLCLTASGTCVQCKANTDCNAPTPGCSSGNSCVSCTLDSQCGAATPICDTSMNQCGRCTTDSACKRKDPTLPLCLVAPGNGTCVQCRADSDCSGATPGCSAANKCVPCTVDAHCGGATPICEVAANRCIACTSDAQCTAKATLGGNPGVCMAHVDGHCAVDSETLYVENHTGCTDAIGGGTSTTPFCSMQGAVAGLATGKVIVVRGPVGSATSGLSVANVSIVGQRSAVIAAALSPAIRITGGNVYLRDLTLSSVSDVGCVAASGSVLRMDHVAATSSRGGILVDGAAFDIRNSTIQFNNANATSDVVWGGIRIQGPVPAAGPRALTRVTISGNAGPGLSCATAIQGTGLFVSNNLLSDVSPSCMVTACAPAGPTCGAGPPP